MSLGKNRPAVDEDDEMDEAALTPEPSSHELLWRYLRDDTEHSARLLQRQLAQEIAGERWPAAERTAMRLTDMCAHLRGMDALEANVACVVKQYED